jgi:hypothetical protein
VLESGDTLDYAFGLTIGSVRGLPAVRHGGALMGFRADIVRFPGEHTSIVTLCNLGSIDPGALADRVAAFYLGERMLPPAARSPAVPPSRAAAAPATVRDPAAFQGRFWSDELAAAWDVALAGDTLRLSRRLQGTQPLLPTGPEQFQVGSQVLHFERDASGRVSVFTVQAGRVLNIRFVRQ